MSNSTSVNFEPRINANGEPYCAFVLNDADLGCITPNELRRACVQWIETSYDAESDAAARREAG